MQVMQSFPHQEEHLQNHKDRKAWGLFWEQGTGKTRPIIQTCEHLFRNKKINAMLVVAPPGVERNWNTDELPVHLSKDVKHKVFVFNSKKSANKSHIKEIDELISFGGLSILLISYPAFMTKIGKGVVWNFLKKRQTLYVLDESQNIKTPKAKRTISINASSKYAEYKRILTGTPVSIGAFDYYSQIRFLDNEFWKSKGIDNFHDYKQYFGIWLTAEEVKRELGWNRNFDELKGYQNLDKLIKWLEEISDRKTKDLLNLPPKLFTKRYFDMTNYQRKIYDELVEEYIYQFENGAILEADMAMVRLLRLQQIICGYVPVDGDEPVELLGKNPRIELLKEICDTTFTQGIIWARFRYDIDQIMEMLGTDAVRYDGSIDADEAEQNKLKFQRGEVKWFVSTAQRGGPGLTLHMAKTVIYYSNSFRLIDRLQSEDRAHRAGMDNNAVNYIDLVCNNSVDESIIENLKNKLDIASSINGDKLREWL